MKKNTNPAPKKILLIKLRKLGDVLSTTPATRQLRALYPDAQITFLSEPLGSKVYAHSNYIDRLWILNKNPSYAEYLKLMYKVFRERFDLVIDFYDHNKTALLTIVSRAHLKFGFSKTNKRTIAYNRTVLLTDIDGKNVYCVNHQLKLIKALGANFNDDKIEFAISDAIKQKGTEFAQKHNFTNNTIAFCVLSERAIAQVSVSLLVLIGNFLLKKGYRLYFVYGPGEKEQALNVYQQMESKEECLIDYQVPELDEERAILEMCCMFIGNDGGNKHLAVAAGIPTIGLFHSDNPLVWTPEDRSKHRFLQTKNNEHAFEEFQELFSNWSIEEGIFK